MTSYSINYVLGWIYFDSNILKTQLNDFNYDKPVKKHVKLNIRMKYDDFCNVLFSKFKIDRDIYDLKLKYRCRYLEDFVGKLFA